MHFETYLPTLYPDRHRLLLPSFPSGEKQPGAAPHRCHRSRHAERSPGYRHRLQPDHLRKRKNGHPRHPLLPDDEHRTADLRRSRTKVIIPIYTMPRPGTGPAFFEN